MKNALTAATLVAASFLGTPCEALPVAGLSAVPAETSIQTAAWRRHRYYPWDVLEIAPGLYYGCRPGWYCFGPPYGPPFTRAWYGGFNSIYGYQGGRWRPAGPHGEY